MYLSLVHLRHQLGKAGVDLLEAVVDGLAGYPLFTGYISAELHFAVDGIDQVDLLRGQLLHSEEQLTDARIFTKGILEGALSALGNEIHRMRGVTAFVRTVVFLFNFKDLIDVVVVCIQTALLFSVHLIEHGTEFWGNAAITDCDDLVAVILAFLVPDEIDIVAVLIHIGLAIGVVPSLALVLVVFLLHCLSFPALGREAADTTKAGESDDTPAVMLVRRHNKATVVHRMVDG